MKKIDDLQKITSSLSVHLTGSTHKKDIVDRIVGMAQIGAVSEIAPKKFTVIFKCCRPGQEIEWCPG